MQQRGCICFVFFIFFCFYIGLFCYPSVERCNNRYIKANALCWQHFPPIFYQLFICFANRPYIPVQIKQTKWVNVVVIFPQSSIPINLIGKRIPREPNNRNSVIPNSYYICPFFPKPVTASSPLAPCFMLVSVCITGIP